MSNQDIPADLTELEAQINALHKKTHHTNFLLWQTLADQPLDSIYSVDTRSHNSPPPECGSPLGAAIWITQK
jgi:hypothetical protein